MTEKKQRLANVELLRSLAMIMVVIMHFLTHSDSLIELDQSLSSTRIIGMLLENFCLAAVNVYVFISGFYGIKSTFKPSRVLTLICQIWFYALLIPLALTVVNNIPAIAQATGGIPTAAGTQGVYGLIQYIFPIETEHYWFATSYFMLYLLTPILNKAANGLTQKQFKIILAGLLILFCGIKSISPVVFAFDKYGYDLPWFICVYLVAAYLRKFGSRFFEKKSWLVYAGSALAGFGIGLLMWFLAAKSDNFAYYFTVPYHYNFILCLTGAIGLFYGFSKINIKEGKTAQFLRRLGTLSFGVYLLHEHIDIRYLWYGWLKNLINPTAQSSMAYFLLELIFCVIVVFTAGITIDWIRSLLFKSVAKVLKNTMIGRGMQKLDRTFRIQDTVNGEDTAIDESIDKGEGEV